MDFSQGGNSFVKPDDFAKYCMQGENDLVKKCQQQALDDFSPEKQNTTITTLWESCCSLYEEIRCYEANADRWCSPVIAFEVKSYCHDVYYKVNIGICRNIYWDMYCRKNHQPIPVYKSHKFVRLPYASPQESECINRLENITTDASSSSINQKIVNENLISNCEDEILKRYDPFMEKNWNANGDQVCCGMYELMNCIDKHARKYCTQIEQRKWSDYMHRTLTSFSSLTICKNNPYSKDKLQQCLNGNNSSTTTTTSPLMIILIMFIVGIVIGGIVYGFIQYKKQQPGGGVFNAKNFFRL
ncbi:hypothetical protein DERP_004654 [Dermatophagoides pteronyssinus]|uniref:Uncharacterized protein n=1 Tax=Dermatophagoides pteronyssinus TaxID=6956 RepID=A0ABQ8JPI0_DERPT|nr:hypothetical protein DERP_004654 [Dermatophagoides pteronyssinus]